MSAFGGRGERGGVPPPRAPLEDAWKEKKMGLGEGQGDRVQDNARAPHKEAEKRGHLWVIEGGVG